MTQHDIITILRVLVTRGDTYAPGFRAQVRFDSDRGSFPAARDFAWCEATIPPTIVLSTKILREDRARVWGILAHEVGHAIDVYLGARESRRRLRAAGVEEGRLTPERRADELAWVALRVHVAYDDEDLQTTRAGVVPRPVRLGK